MQAREILARSDATTTSGQSQRVAALPQPKSLNFFGMTVQTHVRTLETRTPMM